jgi:CBS domain containing-hemolysin-like protein
MNTDLLETLAGKAFVAILLVLFNGFFVAAEIALVKIRDTQLEAAVTKRRRGAIAARALKRNLNVAITATQLGITLAGMGLGRYVEPMVEVVAEPALHSMGLPAKHWAYSVALGAGFVLMSFILMIGGEALPKALAINRTEPITLAIANPLTWFIRIARPFIFVVNGAALWIAHKLGVESLEEDGAHSPEELRLMVMSANKSGPETELGRDIVLNSLDLRRRIVAEVMRPRREITYLNTDASMTVCLELAEKSRYSRLPLCEHGDIDRTLGVVHFKDLFAQRELAHHGGDLLGVARKLIFVPETTRLEKLLQLFLDRKLHFALVVDEYGCTTGMVTLENILEELVGQIQDEFDFEKPRVTRHGDAEWELDGTLPLFELAELTGEVVEAGNVTTLSGWVTQQLGGFPRRNDEVTIGGFTLTVEDLDGLRVQRVRLRRILSPDKSPEKTTN